MFGKIGTGTKERLPESIPLKIRSFVIGTNYLQKRWGLSLVHLRYLETELGKK
jgi:hypothetical protein